MALEFNQYSAVEPFLNGYPAWVGDPLEQRRIAAYQFYEELYDNVPGTLTIVQRGSDDKPIYVPSAKVIVNTCHRYLAPGFNVIPDPTLGTPQQQALALQVWQDLAKRERIYSRFSANKRDGLIRGDWLWHLYADPNKPAGSRVSILPLDPGGWFPIYNEDNLDEIIGVHIVEQFIDSTGKERIRRLTYRKATGTGGPSPIDVTDEVYELDKWGGPGLSQGSPLEVLQPPHTLPSPIDDLPVYPMQNTLHNGSAYGSSELSGLERLIAAISQGISDEELSLAMDGLGMYATTAGAPLDESTGLDAPWDLGPAKVVEHPQGTEFIRVNGVGSVTPYQNHLEYLHARLDEAAVQPAVAKGRVDVQVAESGVALMLELGPLLAHTEEKELIITDVMNNLLYNLPKWYIAYEGTAFNSLLEVTRWLPLYGDKVPVNKTERFANLLSMVSANVIPLTVFWDEIRKLGYTLPDDQTMAEALIQQQSNAANIAADAVAARVNGELNKTDPLLNNG